MENTLDECLSSQSISLFITMFIQLPPALSDIILKGNIKVLLIQYSIDTIAAILIVSSGGFLSQLIMEPKSRW